MQVRDDVSTYDLAWQFETYDEPLSVVVVEAAEATVLFGSGDEDTADELIDIAESHGVDVVVAEHGDGDHYAGVPALREALPGVEAAIPAGDAPKVREEAGIEFDVLLEGGASYWGIETISAPGHTPDNLAYRYGDVLIAGDTVGGSDSPFTDDGPWSGPLAPMDPRFDHDTAMARESISALRSVDFEAVLVAHGSNVLEGGPEAVETLVADLA